MILNSQQKLSVRLASDPDIELPIAISYADIDLQGGLLAGDTVDTLTQAVSEVDILSPPASDVQRQIKTINVFNPNTTPVKITLRLISAGVPRILFAGFMEAETPLTWTPGAGWGPNRGEPGRSAYQVWLAAGNSGTEADYLESLTGPGGASAYQVWLAAGNTGTVEDYNESLKGAAGEDGPPGPQGTPGYAFNIRGPYDAGETYVANDAVVDGDSAYVLPSGYVGDLTGVAPPASPWLPDPTTTSALLAQAAADAALTYGNPYLETADDQYAMVYVNPISRKIAYFLDRSGILRGNFASYDGVRYARLDETISLDEDGFVPVSNILNGEGLANFNPNLETADGHCLMMINPLNRKVLMKGDRYGRLYADIYRFDGTPYGTSNQSDEIQALHARIDARDWSPVYAPQRLRQFAQRSRSIINGATTTPITWAAIGDSWTGNRDYYCSALASALQGGRLNSVPALGDGGPGWSGFAFGTSVVGGVSSSVVIGKTGSWVSLYATGASADIGQVYSSTAGDRFVINGPAGLNAAVLHASSGVLRYSWNNGVSWTDISITGDSLQFFTLAGLPTSAWSLILEVVSGTVKLSGIDLQKSGGGLRFHKLGKNGSHTGQWAGADSASFVAGMTQLAPHVISILHGTNDQFLSGAITNTPSEYAENLSTIIDRCRLAAPTADILLITPPSVRTQGEDMSLYAAAKRQVAISKSCTDLDLQPFFGEAYADYAFGSARPLLDSSVIHPSAAGGAVINEAILRTLFNAF